MFSKRNSKGFLLVEAVIGAFIMVFAFAAASSLFSAALQWESRGATLRQAAFIAERKFSELRAWSRDTHSSTGFSLDWSSQEGSTTYPDAPGFEVVVRTAPMDYQTTPIGQAGPPPQGFYSPCSSFYNQPPANLRRNQQRNATWQTFPYSRDFSNSYRRVEVTVLFGNGGSREYKAVTIIGDPIAPLQANPIRLIKDSGPNTLSKSNLSTFIVYRVEVLNADGNVIPDVSATWSVIPDTSTGNARLVPQDPTGRTVRVYPARSAGDNTDVYLGVKIRYGGAEVVGEMTTNPIGITP